ncbi:MAG: hypothetical protein WC889_13445 [Myxococcota bacterium]|jgi:hypothetical protein
MPRMNGLETKILIVGAIYVVFIVLYGFYKDRWTPTSMRSRRTRNMSAESAGFATTEYLRHEKRIKYARLITTALVVVSFLILAVVMYFGIKVG